MGFNLHSVAGPIVGAVNGNVIVTLKQGTGYATGIDGSRTPSYATSTMSAQIQGMQSDDIRILNAMGIQGYKRKIYLWGSWKGLIRGLQTGNDLVVFPDDTEWKIVVVVEDFGHGLTGQTGWCSVLVVLQNPTSEG